MRPIVLGTVVALAGVAYSQSGLPTCAQNCVDMLTSGSEIGNCGSLDIACICSSPSFLTDIACCLASACDAADQQASIAYAIQICATAGVTVPDSISSLCTSTTTSATSTTSSSVVHSSSSAGSSNGTSVTSSTSAATISTTSSSSVSSTASATKNAGIQNAAGAGMSFAGGLAAVFALL